MNARSIVWGLVLVALSVIVQTTLFSRLDDLGVVADIVMVVVLVSARWLDPEPALLLGFTGGVLYDLNGTTPIGLRAMVFTILAYGAVRLATSSEGSHVSAAIAVVVLSFAGVVLFTMVGTLFGQGSLRGISVIQTFVLLPIFNGVLSIAIGPLIKRVMVKEKVLL